MIYSFIFLATKTIFFFKINIKLKFLLFPKYINLFILYVCIIQIIGKCFEIIHNWLILFDNFKNSFRKCWKFEGVIKKTAKILDFEIKNLKKSKIKNSNGAQSKSLLNEDLLHL